MNGSPQVDSDSPALVKAKLLASENRADFLALAAEIDALHRDLCRRLDELIADAAHRPQESWLAWLGKLLVISFVAACAGTGFGHLIAPLIRDLLLWLK